jgi:twitching motility protein PilU
MSAIALPNESSASNTYKMNKDQATAFLGQLLTQMVAHKGSDLFLSADFPPAIKLDGKLTKVSQQILSGVHTQAVADAIMSDKQKLEFAESSECNFAIAPEGISRFRVSAYVQKGSVGLVIRIIPNTLPNLDVMGMPQALKELVMLKHGLCILVGATGSGKSTTLAAMLDWRNSHSQGHIITIEDPVEFVHPNKNCLVTQREVGIDTHSWEVALKNTLRQAPDVILMGEIRDRDTMDQALAIAKTGHLCLATLHANNTNQAFDRILNFFPEERRLQLLSDLSANIRGLVSQRLVTKSDGKGRVAAVEILTSSALVSQLVLDGRFSELKDVISKSRGSGMQTFDQALFELYESGDILLEDAIRNADSANDLRLTVKLNSKRGDSNSLDAGTEHLEII